MRCCPRSIAIAVALPFAVAVAACGGGSNPGTGDDDDTTLTACTDGVDNDGDGQTDFPDDLGCTSPADESEDSPTSPQCSDGRDNDDDGKLDFPDDPGCLTPNSDDETDDCPDGPSCPQCGNGQDDDGNGEIDFPDDPGCDSAGDPIEFVENSVACGDGLTIEQLPVTGMDSGTLDATSTSQITSPCGGGNGSPAVAYVFTLTEPKVLVASTDDAATTADTVLDLRSADCANPDSELACNDDLDATGDNLASSLTRSLPVGTYYLIVSGHDASSVGDYTLRAQLLTGEGAACTSQDDCGPGLVCRVPGDGTAQVCTKPVCSDGFDDDDDGKTDFPDDPGCASPDGGSEVDDCPDGPNCPECANGQDDDGDGQTDYPDDVTCMAAGDASESCTTSEGVEVLTQPATAGSTLEAVNDILPTCAADGSVAPDRHYRLDLPTTTTLSINLTDLDFDSVTQLLDASCGAAELACSDPDELTVEDLAAGTYFVVVDGFFDDSAGAYTINVSGQIAPGESCESALAQSGALTCPPSFACKGEIGQRTCAPAECSDGVDNNGDDTTDYPNDPGCESPVDDTEETLCPGPLCPECANGDDDDLDQATDFPADFGCAAAGSDTELFCTSESDFAGLITQPTTAGSLADLTNDNAQSCQDTTGNDTAFALQLDIPVASLQIDTNGSDVSDTVLSVRDASCALELACDDDGGDILLSSISLTNVPAGNYAIQVDAFGTSNDGDFTLNVHGTIASGASCESPLVDAGVLTCEAGITCTGPAGARICQPPACGDGIDNNGDGTADFPLDPGCANPLDDTEDTVCPGPACPACANGDDDDADTLTDFPGDFGCAAAGADSEVFCSVETDPAAVIATPATAGTLAGQTDDHEQSCQSSTGNDVAFALQLPVPVASLQIDTNGSTISDTVISLHDAACGAELECDDDDGDDFRSLLELTNVPAGNYAIQVDGFSSSNDGEFTLNVKGTVAPQTACTDPLFAAGVLACPTGTTCTAGICQ